MMRDSGCQDDGNKKEVFEMMTRLFQRGFFRKALLAGLTALFVFAAALPASVLAHDVEEKEKMDKGFYLGLRFIGSSLHVDEAENDVFFVKDDGGGFEFIGGYHFNGVFALELSAGAAGHETSDPRIDAAIGFVRLFAVYRFVPENSFRPYIKGGLGGYGLGLNEGSVSADISGGGIAFGGGFDYIFSRHFGLGVDFTHNIINYNEATIDFGENSFSTEIDEEGSQSSLGLSMSYFF